MIDEATPLVVVGAPAQAGASREGTKIELIVCVDAAGAGRKAAEEATSGGAPANAPNYWIDRDGTVLQLVADERAGEALGLAVYERRRKNIDRLALSVALERRERDPSSDLQVAALHRLLDELYARHGLDESALATILPDEEGRPRVYAYLPPAPAIEETGDVLGAAPDPAAELRSFLWGETWKQRAGATKQDTAFGFYAAKNGLGAPMAPNGPPALSFGGKSYNIQVFARDTIYNEGSDWTGVQSYRASLEGRSGPDELGLALMSASFDASVKASEARLGAPFKHTKNFRSDWRFHIVAANSALGPAISDNYVFTADQQYAFQVFAGDTLYTPMNEQTGFYQLSLTEPAHPAYHKLWEETYKYAKAAYDPNNPFQQRAAADKLGTPLSGVYQASHAGATYTIQVFALDTLYAGPDGQIKRMSELPLITAIAAWSPTTPKVQPPPAPAYTPPPAAPAQIGKASPVPNDPNWPPLPKFGILTDKGGARERLLGRIEWYRSPVKGEPRAIKITNGWDKENIILVNVPQLHKFTGGKPVQFHRAAAESFQRFWAEVERQGYLPLVLAWSGTWVPRVMTSNYGSLSNHAYGTAFDINVKWNGWQVRPALVGQQGSVRELVPIANAFGFFWGGHWSAKYYDGMHFEWAGR